MLSVRIQLSDGMHFIIELEDESLPRKKKRLAMDMERVRVCSNYGNTRKSFLLQSF